MRHTKFAWAMSLHPVAKAMVAASVMGFCLSISTIAAAQSAATPQTGQAESLTGEGNERTGLAQEKSSKVKKKAGEKAVSAEELEGLIQDLSEKLREVKVREQETKRASKRRNPKLPASERKNSGRRLRRHKRSWSRAAKNFKL